MNDYSNAGGAGMAALAGMMMTIFVIAMVIALFMIICFWKIFTKAGKPGWAAIIPIYNTIVMLEIAGKPIWWIILMFIPFVNLIMLIILMIALAKSYGQGAGFAIGMIFLPIIFFPILAFGSSTYIGPDGGMPSEPSMT